MLCVEAKTEYVNRYVVGALGELTWSTEAHNEVTRNICNINLQKPLDHTIPWDDGPLSPSLTQRLPPLDINLDETLQLGYMPNRDDYERVCVFLHRVVFPPSHINSIICKIVRL